MKRLALLRHAKSAWDDPELADFDRPLNERGRRAAAAMGAFARARGLHFDAVIASPARRVRETLAAFGAAPEPAWEPALYEATGETALRVIRAASASAGSLLVAGHAPGLPAAALSLARSDTSADARRLCGKYPTGALAEFDVACGWEALASATLTRFTCPRDLLP